MLSFSDPAFSFGYVVSVDPLAILTAITTFEKQVLLGFTFNHTRSRRHFLRFGFAGLRFAQKSLHRVGLRRLKPLAGFQFGDGLDRARFEYLRPQLRKKRVR